MKLQEAIDNAPVWARWLGIDNDGLCAAYFEIKPSMISRVYVTPCGNARWKSVQIDDATSPQLIEVNK